MNPDDFEALAKAHTFKPAPTGATTDECIAVALKFIAKEIGGIAWSVDHLNDQMDSLISETQMK